MCVQGCDHPLVGFPTEYMREQWDAKGRAQEQDKEDRGQAGIERTEEEPHSPVPPALRP
jgi:hypothetical protein